MVWTLCVASDVLCLDTSGEADVLGSGLDFQEYIESSGSIVPGCCYRHP